MSTTAAVCYARRMGTDEMRCNVCKLTWSLDDEKPACVSQRHSEPAKFASGTRRVDSTSHFG